MKTNRIIFLDIDGVLADFVSGALKALNVDPKNVTIPNGELNIEKWNGVNVSTRKFWDAIDKTKEEFWINLEKLPWADQLVSELSKQGDLYFLTSPSRNPHCLSGKMYWIQKHYTKMQRKVIFTPDKFLLAAPNRYLIDDTPDKINKFNEFGGNGILFPAKYNSLAAFADNNKIDMVQYVLGKINGFTIQFT